MTEQSSATTAIVLDPAQLQNIARLQHERGFETRDATVRWLLDIAFEAVSGAGRRFWDQPIAADASVAQARYLAERLHAQGYTVQAERLHEETMGERIGNAMLEGLRETCQTVLTTIEALDPKTQLLAEELRLEVDKRLAAEKTR